MRDVCVPYPTSADAPALGAFWLDVVERMVINGTQAKVLAGGWEESALLEWFRT